MKPILSLYFRFLKYWREKERLREKMVWGLRSVRGFVGAALVRVKIINLNIIYNLFKNGGCVELNGDCE